MKPILVLLLALACLPCQAQPTSMWQLDVECGNDRPLASEFDSLYGPWPELIASATRAVLTPDRSLLAFTFENLKDFPMTGIMIVDARSGARRAFIPGQLTSEWHPYDRKLLTNHYIYDVDADEFMYLPSDPDGNGINHWSPDGRFAYLRLGNHTLARTDANGRNLEYLPTIRQDFFAISDTMFVTFNSAGIEFAGISGLSRRVVELPGMPELRVRNVLRERSSLDAKFVVADFQRSGWKFDTTNTFLGLVDLQLLTLKKVVLSQRLGNFYYPSWTREGTLIVSYVCRDDSVRGVWEMDTSGMFLRQFVGRDVLRRVLSSVPDAAASSSSCSIRSLHPHPVSGEGILSYEVSAPGTYSIRVMDAAGRIVRAPFEGAVREPGVYSVAVSTAGLPPGMYLLRLSEAGGSDAQRVIVVGK